MAVTVMNSLGLIFRWDETSGLVTVDDGYTVVHTDALPGNTRDNFRVFIGEYVRNR